MAEIVKATVADIEEIADIEKRVFSDPWSEEVFISSVSYGTELFAAKENGRVVGYIAVKTVADEGSIDNIAVAPEYRRQGIGRALMGFADGYAEDEDLSVMFLEVRASNAAAISLYGSCGYECYAVRKNYYSFPDEDALCLRKRMR